MLDTVVQPIMTLFYWLLIYTLYLFAFNQATVEEKSIFSPRNSKKTIQDQRKSINSEYSSQSDLILETETETDLEKDDDLQFGTLAGYADDDLEDEERLLQRTILKNLINGGFKQPKSIRDSYCPIPSN